MPKRKSKALVVVESPAKARTISRILGSDYEVKASIGHVRDLPKSALGVDVEKDFLPKYIISRGKSKAVKEIREAARKAGTVYLATDPDREGEAIAWHLLEAAEMTDQPHSRVVFHEITPEAVKEAFRHPREIDMQLVDAQQARRVLDRLIGYRLSPFLWKKIRRGLSAGRVQSVALRLVAEREREIQAFKAQEYWSVAATLEKENAVPSFRAKLTSYTGKRKKLVIPSEAESKQLTNLLSSAAYRIGGVQQKAQVRRPAAPFITSTLQQEASRRLGFSARRAMAVAQQLYEGMSLGHDGEVGLITYMRTDSTHVATSAQEEVRAYIRNRFGGDFLPPSARAYRRRVKGAQEAHEAIRPTSAFRTPNDMKRFLTKDQHQLYALIWQRMVASQMADALFDVTTAEIEATPRQGREVYLLRATNTQLRFPGFRQVYVEGRDEEDDEEALGTNPMPELAADDPLKLIELLPEQHFTEPPPRYTEASLVKVLEEKGVGRPSTYAPTMTTIQERGYVEREGRYLRPSDLGFVVNDLLVEHFPDFVNVGFTAGMEVDLDEIAWGERPWQPMVKEFHDPLEDALARAASAPKQEKATEERCPECDRPMIIRWGRRGQFLACSGFPECQTSRSLDGEDDTPQTTNETCQECNMPMVVKTGRFGRFLACSRYPKCKGRRPLATKTGVNCPRCGADIVERRSKRGRTFFGCSSYPKCDFTVWNQPLSQPCPQCQGLLTAERDGQTKCNACDWRGEVEAHEPKPTTVV